MYLENLAPKVIFFRRMLFLVYSDKTAAETAAIILARRRLLSLIVFALAKESNVTVSQNGF